MVGERSLYGYVLTSLHAKLVPSLDVIATSPYEYTHVYTVPKLKFIRGIPPCQVELGIGGDLSAFTRITVYSVKMRRTFLTCTDIHYNKGSVIMHRIVVFFGFGWAVMKDHPATQ